MSSTLPLLVAWFVAVAIPGPDFVAVLRTSAAHGRRAGLSVAVGVVGGMACWATCALVGLSAVIARYEHLYLVIRTVGAVLLFLYGARVLIGAFRGHRPETGHGVLAPDQGGSHSFWRLGLFTNLANPKAVVFFGALFASLLPHGLSVGGRVGVLGAILAIGLAWYVVVASAASSAPVVAAYRRAGRAIDVVAGSVFAITGIALVPRN
ncbi:LysE family translocator [Allobranchiibius huperziae]|uniref:Threonine/homoserine/homoserine lactone efflux protein n=1 Tax=Allobranchiibius huperziae TaxID=1874116 RepID=A0A853DKJ4_9MICO|nr:LysE family translocator [Allobranchiibius huperziae]NYJ75210.1 threonine/homoserine/homoserine lactone efflux protein [Allobranchiibius huperziae]